MAFTAFDLFSPIDASIVPGILGLNRLRINQDIGRMLVFALLLTSLLIERVKGLFPHPALIPTSVMLIDGIPRRKIQRQHPPRDAAVDHSFRCNPECLSPQEISLSTTSNLHIAATPHLLAILPSSSSRLLDVPPLEFDTAENPLRDDSILLKLIRLETDGTVVIPDGPGPVSRLTKKNYSGMLSTRFRCWNISY